MPLDSLILLALAILFTPVIDFNWLLTLIGYIVIETSSFSSDKGVSLVSKVGK